MGLGAEADSKCDLKRLNTNVSIKRALCDTPKKPDTIHVSVVS